MDDKRIINLLSDTEKSLVQFSSEAARDRDYDRAAILLGLAREIRVMAARLEPAKSIATVSNEREGRSAKRPVARRSRARAQSPIGPRRGRRAAYPQFFRSGNSLLKVGFSKLDGEYEHKAPDRVLFALANALAKAGDRGRHFTMDELMPQIGSALEADVPNYQPYVCLSWLKSLGLINQHGRQGYSTQNAAEIARQVHARWEQLSPRLTPESEN